MSTSSVLASLIANILWVAFVVSVGAFGLDRNGWLFRIYRVKDLFLAELRRQKIVLLCTDCHDEGATTSTLVKRLNADKTLAASRLKVRGLDNFETLVRWPFSRQIHSIIILSTDVTPLSVDDKRRKRLEKRLARYAIRGGRLILGHDVLYRRARNDNLQQLVGGRVWGFDFSDTGKIDYCWNPDSGVDIGELPRAFSLSDGELLRGRWAADVEAVFVSRSEPDVPLVTRREVGKGLTFWLNSGDHTETGPPRSIAQPEPIFVQLLAWALSSRLDLIDTKGSASTHLTSSVTTQPQG